MRSTTPDGRNPWPQDMVIRVEDHDLDLYMLLFVRHAWQLAPTADVPDLDPVPAPGQSARPDTPSHADWTRRWAEAWERSWNWYRGSDAVHRAAARAGALARMPSWLSAERPPDEVLDGWARAQTGWLPTYGREGVDMDAYQRWTGELRADPPPRWGESPEHQSLPALIGAWQTGLETIVTLPYRGYFAQDLSEVPRGFGRCPARSGVVRKGAGDAAALNQRWIDYAPWRAARSSSAVNCTKDPATVVR